MRRKPTPSSLLIFNQLLTDLSLLHPYNLNMKSAPEVSLLPSSLDDLYFFLVIVPILLCLLYFEHRRQLKKFKKVWKDRLETGLSSLKDSHKKRLNDFRV